MQKLAKLQQFFIILLVFFAVICYNIFQLYKKTTTKIKQQKIKQQKYK